MNLIVHDTSTEGAEYADCIVFNLRKLQLKYNCAGCFGCWVKTPGICVIKDDLQLAAPILGNTESFIIISNITYGGYSSEVKRFMDRSLGYIQPYFTRRGNEMHHVSRYTSKLNLIVIGYGAKSELEKTVFGQLVAANALNMNADGLAYIVEDEASAWRMVEKLKEEINV